MVLYLQFLFCHNDNLHIFIISTTIPQLLRFVTVVKENL
nr:MAG TPA: hypothetical protein [Caudoviricetes sp.]